MSDRDFLDYNIDNIFKNLLQAEYHAKNIVGGSLQPEHLSCINKHLAFVEGEAEEATAHCRVGKPNLCDFFNGFLLKVKRLRAEIRKHGGGPDLQHRIRELRKEIERAFKEYDTSQCKVCKIVEDIFEKVKSGGVKMAKITEELERQVRDMMAKDPAGLSELLKVIADECYEIGQHLETNWQDNPTAKWWYRLGKRIENIASEVEDELGDPVPPSEVKELLKKGLEVKPHPICVISKVAKGMSEPEAERACLEEGKVHPISYWAAKIKVS